MTRLMVKRCLGYEFGSENAVNVNRPTRFDFVCVYCGWI